MKLHATEEHSAKTENVTLVKFIFCMSQVGPGDGMCVYGLNRFGDDRTLSDL